MPKMPISLARNYDSHFGGAVPSQPSQEMFYPNVHLEWDDEYKLADEGTITFKYRVTRDVLEKVPKERNCVDIDVLEIVEVKPAKSEKEDYGGDALDKLKEEAEEA